MQLYFRFVKRPGESHLALDGKKLEFVFLHMKLIFFGDGVGTFLVFFSSTGVARPDSKRCLGAVVDDLPGKVHQAEPLTVSDVKRLHWVLEHRSVWDRIFSGAALFCMHARARWSDFIHGNHLRLDTQTDGNIVHADMEVQVHKTMRASANRFKFGLGCVGHWNGRGHKQLHVFGFTLTLKRFLFRGVSVRRLDRCTLPPSFSLLVPPLQTKVLIPSALTCNLVCMFGD